MSREIHVGGLSGAIQLGLQHRRDHVINELAEREETKKEE